MALTDNLISAWELDEASGTRADSHGSNDLTDDSTVGSNTGLVYSNAADMVAASNDTLSHVSNASLQTGDIDFSIECWIYINTTSGGYILAKEAGGNLEYALWLFFGTIEFSVWDSGSTETKVTVSGLSAATWYNVVCYHDATNNVLGIIVNDGTPSTTAYSAGLVAGTASFLIGNNGFSSGYYDGRIGPVRFWKKVLSSTEITQLYNSGSGLAYSAFGGGGGITYPQLERGIRGYARGMVLGGY